MKRTYPSHFVNGQKGKTMKFIGDEREMAKKHQEVHLTGNPHYTNQNIEMPSFTYQVGMDFFKEEPEMNV